MNRTISVVTRNNIPIMGIGTEEYITPIIQNLNYRQEYKNYNIHVIDIVNMKELNNLLTLPIETHKNRWETLDELNLIEKTGLKLYKESLNPDNEFYADEDLILNLIKIREDIYKELEFGDYDTAKIANEMIKRFIKENDYNENRRNK